ncbi:MAG: hypothetical protein MI923_30115 [Phycisphaerales bacterium]|nr:hypothetical protein [Phycisphaerales bacterium]
MHDELTFPTLPQIFLKSPRRSPEALGRTVDAQLRMLVRHAYERIPFYRDYWKHTGFHPDDLTGRTDLPAIPMVDKDMIVEAGQSVLDPCVPEEELDTLSTSGTSGRAITIRRTIRELRVSRRSYLRSLFYVGARPWHRFVTFASTWLHSKRGLFVRKICKTQHLFPKDSLDQQIETLKSFRAVGLAGQTGGLYLLARELLRRGTHHPLKFLAPTGATLMPEMRQTMRDAFLSEPRDLYGAVELGAVSWQCRRGNYHVDADRMAVEIVDDAGKPVPHGQTGQVVCTGLYGYTMPLIRYRLLDVAALSVRTCDCGIQFPLMEPVQGRINDFLPTPQGDLVSPHFLFHIFDHAGGSPVKEWRVIQRAPEDLTYEYVPEDDFSSAALEKGMQAIRERFGAKTQVRAVEVSSIPMTPNGKRTCIVSQLRTEDVTGMRPWDEAVTAGMAQPCN